MKTNTFRTAFCRFIEGNLFPLVVGEIVFLGHITGLEFYGNMLLFLMFLPALCLSDSVRPFLVMSLMFIYQVTLRHSPALPYASTYYFETWRLVVFIILAAGLVVCLSYYMIRTHFFRDIFRRGVPLLFPLLAFSVSLLLNGAGSDGYVWGNLSFAATQVAVCFFGFFLVWHGLGRENLRDFPDYLMELVHIVAWILIGQMLFLLASRPEVFRDGSLVKEEILFGWGIYNTMGMSLTVLIPLCFYGALRGRYRAFSFVTVCALYVSAALTLSRNALLFGTLALVVSWLVACFTGLRSSRRVFRRITLVGIAGVLLLIAVFHRPIFAILNDVLQRGLDNNGRFTIWRAAWERFLRYPVAGGGFFGVVTEGAYDFAAFFPEFAHNTIMEILAACGILGFGSYLWYRVSVLRAFLRRRSQLNTLMFLSLAVLLLESLLDVFVFLLYPMFLANILIAYTLRASEAPAENV